MFAMIVLILMIFGFIFGTIFGYFFSLAVQVVLVVVGLVLSRDDPNGGMGENMISSVSSYLFRAIFVGMAIGDVIYLFLN